MTRAAVAFALVSCAVLFEPLVGAAGPAAFDPRIVPPFRHHLAAGEPPRPMNVVGGDDLAWLLPERLMHAQRRARGHSSDWNPHESLGQPLGATLGHVPLYPTSWLDHVLPVPFAHVVELALHLALLGLGTWTWLAGRGRSWSAAFLGGLTVTLSTWCVLHLSSPPAVRAMAWIPWMLVAADRLARRPDARGTALAAVVVALGLAAGFPQVTAAGLLAGAASGAERLVARRRRREHVGPESGRRRRGEPAGAGPAARATEGAWRAVARSTGAATVAIGLGVLLAAPVWLPAFAYRGHTPRAPGAALARPGVGAAPAVGSADKTLPVASLAGLVLPHLFGPVVATVDPLAPAVESPWDFPTYRAWQRFEVQNNPVDTALAVGVLPLALAVLGVRRRRGRGTLAALVLVLLAATGAAGLDRVLAAVPGLGAGSPKRVIVLVPFLLAALASAALDAIGRRADDDPRPGRPARALLLAGLAALSVASLAAFPYPAWIPLPLEVAERARVREVVTPDLLAVGAAGLVLLAAAGLARRPPLARSLLVGATLVAGVHDARAHRPPQPPEAFYASTPTLEWLAGRGAGDGSRIATFDANEVLPGSVAALFGLRSIHAMASLLPRRSIELLAALDRSTFDPASPWALGPIGDIAALGSPLLDRLGVRDVVTGPAGHARLEAAAGEHELTLVRSDRREAVAVWERPRPLPPAVLVERLHVVPGAPRRLARLVSRRFAPDREAIVESAPPVPARDLDTGPVTVRRPAPGRIEIEAPTDGPAFLVVSESLLPGWRATVDGETVALVPADHALMGLALPEAGSHRIVLTYEASGAGTARRLGAMGLVLVAALALGGGRRGAGRRSS